eukprot:Em0145g14a
MDDNSVLQAAEDILGVQSTSPGGTETSFRGGKGLSFTDEQRKLLLKYFDEYGMTSTHRRNVDLMQKCALEVGTTLDRVKNWIGSEAVKRKRKAGILPRPKIEITGTSSQTKFVTPPAAKKFKRVNGYNLFFSYCVRTYPDISTDFRLRNAVVAQRWAELTEEERKHWALKAENVCSLSMQELNAQQQQQQQQQQQHSLFAPSPTSLTPEITTETVLIEKTLLAIQEKFDLLEQLGFEGYAILVNTAELQTHLLATNQREGIPQGKADGREASGEPLHWIRLHRRHCLCEICGEELLPFKLIYAMGNGRIWLIYDHKLFHPKYGLISLSNKRFTDLISALNSTETMQKSVMNAFALKYKVSTGRSEIPYDSLQNLGVQVYGMPPGIPFHSPLLYNQQQLQQILANLEKIVFLKVPQDSIVPPLAEVEITTDTVTSLVSPGHELHIGAEEEAVQ